VADQSAIIPSLGYPWAMGSGFKSQDLFDHFRLVDPGKKRVLTWEKSDFAVALRFSKRKYRRCAQA